MRSWKKARRDGPTLCRVGRAVPLNGSVKVEDALLASIITAVAVIDLVTDANRYDVFDVAGEPPHSALTVTQGNAVLSYAWILETSTVRS